MIIIQRSPVSFAPMITGVSSMYIEDIPGATVSYNTESFIFEKNITASYHYDYILSGVNLDNASISFASSPVELDIPVIRKTPDTASTTTVKLSNSRGETKALNLVFSNLGGNVSYSNPKSIIADTYAEYSWNRVHAIFSQLDNGTTNNHRVFDASGNRRLLDILPHQDLTAQIYKHQHYAMAKRFIAITRRHVIGVGHYNYDLSTAYPIPVYFKTVGSETITRNIIKSYNTYWSRPDNPNVITSSPYKDCEIWLLDEDLPETITPIKFLGDWFYRVEGDSYNFKLSADGFGMCLYNNDYHVGIVQCSQPIPITYYNYNPNTVTVGGEQFSGRELSVASNVSLNVSLEGFSHWSTGLVGGIFYHSVRGGDSGSPTIYPVEDGWAIGNGIVSGNLWRPDAVNALIRAVDAYAGISTDYTVTVAPNPIDI